MLHRRFIRAVSFACAFVVAFTFIIPTLSADFEKTVSSPYAVVYNVENKTFVYEKNSDKETPPGATVKLMTTILALEHYGKNISYVTVDKSALSDIYGGAVIGLVAGETISSYDLIYALLVGGASDAACALAVDIGGSISSFISMMNEKARVLGAKSTLFANPTGLDSHGAKTTARDAALIAAYAYSLDGFMDICSAKYKKLDSTNKSDSRIVSTRNYLISGSQEKQYYYSEASGMSAGYTDSAGYCLVSSVSRKSLSYICVLLGAEKAPDGSLPVYYDAKNLLSWALDSFETKNVLSSSFIVGEISVKFGKGYDFVTVVPESDVYAFLPLDCTQSEISRNISFFSESVQAPVKRGERVGKLSLSYNGNVIGECYVVAKMRIEKNGMLAFRSQLYSLIGSAPFLISLFVVILIFAAFFAVKHFRISEKQARRK